MLAGPQVGLKDHRLVAGRNRDDHVLCGGLVTRAGLPAQLGGQRLGAFGPRVGTHPVCVTDRRQAARRPGAVHAAADHADRLGIVARKGLRGHRSGGARAERSDGAAVEDREQLSGLGARNQERAGDNGQATLRVAGKRRHPFEDRQSVSACRHRPEVAMGRRIDVGLRGHHPLTRVVSHERHASPLDRVGRRDGVKDRIGTDDRQRAHLLPG